jgi:23S rRNA (guanosine2251-2'-O)-methyltransferase
LLRLWIRRGGRGREQEELIALAGEAGIPVDWRSPDELEARLGPDVPSQGVALEAGPLPRDPLEQLLARKPRPGDVSAARVVLALDGVEDPQNVGAIARVAESVGATGLILTDRRAPPLSPALSRASAGAIEWLPVARVGNLARALEQAREAGFWVLAAEPEGGEALYGLSDRVLSGDLVVVLGAEGRGIRPGVLAVSDHRVRLPMRGRIASLNVSTAGAVILYEILRRQLVSPGGKRK